MTSIAGFVANHVDDEKQHRRLSAMFDELPAHVESELRLRHCGKAIFGRTTSFCLPEDKFDCQPLYIDNRYFLVADIRLDNRGELIRQLNNISICNNVSDAEILLQAWKKWQKGCLERIVGDFAFAVYDKVDHRLFLARDPTGQRPLFYSASKNQIAFASMPGGVLAASLTERDFDSSWLVESTLGLHLGDERTAFDQVKRVRPGHIISITHSSIHRERYWSPLSSGLHLSDSEFVESYQTRLADAVSCRLRRAHGELGVHLSSGFDSSAVATTAARYSHGSNPIAFTYACQENFQGPVLRGGMADESRLASLTAQMYRLPHHIVRPPGHALKFLRKNVQIYQHPIRNVVNMDWTEAILRTAKHKGVSTLLTGASGNLSIHWGGLYVLGDWLKTDGWLKWSQQAWAARRLPSTRLRGILFNSFEGFLPARLPPMLDKLFNGMPPPGQTSFLRREVLDRLPELVQREQSIFPAHDSYARRLALIDYQDPGLFWTGAYSEYGVDVRDPMSDRRLFDFSFQLPNSQLLKDGVCRPLMRRALALQLPQEVLNNPLRGVQGADWYQQLRREEINEILEDVAASRMVNELFDLREVRKFVERTPKNGWTDLGVICRYHNDLTNMLSNAVFIDEFEKIEKNGV